MQQVLLSGQRLLESWVVHCHCVQSISKDTRLMTQMSHCIMQVFPGHVLYLGLSGICNIDILCSTCGHAWDTLVLQLRPVFPTCQLINKTNS